MSSQLTNCGLACALLLGAWLPFASGQSPPYAEERPAAEPASSPAIVHDPKAELIAEPAVDGSLTVDSIPLGEPLQPGEHLTEDVLTSLQPLAPFGYNVRRSKTDWLPGGGDQFGMFSLESLPSLPQNQTWGLVSGLGFHFLSGPVRTDMPPRLFDFQIGGQVRKAYSDDFRYDVQFCIGAFSDFEGSAREGIRYPGHAVGYYRWLPGCEFAFGIDYLDRDDIQMLPIAGVILTPTDNLRLELVFPRPSIEYRFSPLSTIYVAGELGGGTWAIERVPDRDDVVTYRDLKVLFGISTRDDDGSVGGIEIGYVFGRDLSYRSGVGDYSLGDAVLIRSTTRY